MLEQSSDKDYNKIKQTKKDLVDVETELRQLNDKTLAKAMKVLTDDQKEALGNRPLPMFMMESSPYQHGANPRWGIHRAMMGGQPGTMGSASTSGSK